MSGDAISWYSRKQSIVARSFCEAGHVSVYTAAEKALWQSRVLIDLQDSTDPRPVVLLVNNQGSIDTVKNVSINSRYKQVNIRNYFARDAVFSNLLKAYQLSWSEQVANSLTRLCL